METAMQELITYIQDRYAGQVSEGIVIKANQLLSKEKVQIEDAYFDAMELPNMWKASIYYEQTYKK